MSKSIKEAAKIIKSREQRSEYKRCYAWLHGPRFELFKQKSRSEGTSASKVIDLWIQESLEKGAKK